MTYDTDLPPIDIVRNPDIPIPDDLLNPHYLDRRYPEKDIGRMVFLSPDIQIDAPDALDSALYLDSAGSLLWHEFGKFQDKPEAAGYVPNSARFFEAALNDLWPRLGDRHLGIIEFGRDIPGIRLLAIMSGINGHTLSSYNEFAVIPRDPQQTAR